MRAPTALTISPSSRRPPPPSERCRSSSATPSISPRPRTPAMGAPRSPSALSDSAEVVAHLRGVAHQTLALDRAHHGDRCRARKRTAAEGRSVVARLEDVGAWRGEDGADRQPAAESLGDGHTSGAAAVVLVRPPATGAAHPGLHLVEDEQHVALVAETRGSPRAVPGSSGRTPLSPSMGSSITAHVVLSIAVSSASMSLYGTCTKPRGSGSNGSRYRAVGRGGEGAERAAVERALRADDLVRAVAMRACPTCARA